MMDTTDDNFFIDEPHKLRSTFFDNDKSRQIVQLLTHKHRASYSTPDKTAVVDTSRLHGLSPMQPCPITYNRKTKQFPNIQQLQKTVDIFTPRTIVDRLEILCRGAIDTHEISVAKRAVDTLDIASKSGCCYLEKFISMLINACVRMYETSIKTDDELMRIKINELFERVLNMPFDKTQLTEHLKRHEYKLTETRHIQHLLDRLDAMLKQKELLAIEILFAVVDAYFVELATSEALIKSLDRISAYTESRCAFMRQSNDTNALLKELITQTGNGLKRMHSNPSYTNRNKKPRLPKISYSIDNIDF